MPPSSTVRGGQYDTKYVIFEYVLHAKFVTDKIWGVYLEPACSVQEGLRDDYAYIKYTAAADIFFAKLPNTKLCETRW